MVLRLISLIILLASVVFVPWWVVLILIIPAIFYFRNFYESAIVALVMDSLHGTSVIFEGFPYVITLSFIVLTFLINKIREKLIMY